MNTKRALKSEEVADKVLCRALGVDSLAKEELAKILPLTRERCAKIYMHLDPFLKTTAPALRAAPDSIQPGAEHEIWSALDIHPLLSAIDGKHRTGNAGSIHVLVQQVADSAKRLLLFAHRIVVFDYLASHAQAIVAHTGRPDEIEDDLETLKARANAIVLVYGALFPLIRHEVVIIGIPPGQYDDDNQAFIVSHRAEISKFSKLAASKFRLNFPGNRLTKIDQSFGGGVIFNGQSGATGTASFKDQKDLKMLSLLIAQGLIPIRRSQPHVQPCFDDLDVAKFYSHMLKMVSQREFKIDLGAPVYMTELSTNGAIIPGALKLEDACHIRDGEEVFATWRDLLGETLATITSGNLSSEERARDFHREVKEREASWRGRFAAIIDHDTFIRRIIDPRQSVLTGLCAGAIHSVLTGGTGAATVTIAATGDVLVTAFELMAGRSIRRASKALQSHFVAVGATPIAP